MLYCSSLVNYVSYIALNDRVVMIKKEVGTVNFKEEPPEFVKSN